MKIAVSYENKDGYCFVRISGEWNTDKLKEFIDGSIRHAEEYGWNSILIDGYELETPKTDFQRFLIGKYAAEAYGSRFRVALYFQPERITKFAENAAVNRGADFRVWGSKEEALQWLLK